MKQNMQYHTDFHQDLQSFFKLKSYINIGIGITEASLLSEPFSHVYSSTS